MKIEQGNIYWYSALGADSVPHPHVVIQDTILNQTRIETTVVCGITSNMKKVLWPGYVLLEENEGNLIKKSLVDISQVLVVKKDELGEFIGKISDERIEQIFLGMKLLQDLHSGN